MNHHRKSWHRLSHGTQWTARLGLTALLTLGTLPLSASGQTRTAGQADRAPAAQADARSKALPLLSTDRWESRAHGLSLRPPLGAQTLELSADDAIVRIGHPDGYKITVYIKLSTRDLSLDEVVKAAIDQASTSPTTVRKVEDPHPVKIGGLDGQGFSFAAPDVTPPAVLAQAFALLTPQKVIILELNADPAVYERARQAYDQVVASVQVEDQAQIAQRRRQLLEAGQTWIQGMTAETINQSLIPEQWFRIVQGQRDIGYMRVTQRRDKALRLQGVRIDVQSRIMVEQVAYDTLANYFVSDEREPGKLTEVWSVRTTARPPTETAGKPRPVPQNRANANPQSDESPSAESSWAETGLLSKGTLTLTRQSPQEKKPYQWSELPDGYLPQAHAQLLTTLIGPADREAVGFYVYDSRSGNLTLRTDRVETSPDGSYRVYSRISPEQPEQVTHFDKDGKLIRRELPGGQTLIPARAPEIVSRWKLQSSLQNPGRK